MTPRLSIVIPVGEGDTPYTTLRTLDVECEIIVVYDTNYSANVARNRGFKLVRTEYVLFSDCDVEWWNDALRFLVDTLDRHPEAAYAYGAYEMGGKTQCDSEFDPDRLRRNNYISTMSVIRSECFPRFDELIKRLQDWDLWLTMLEHGSVGVYCGGTVFETRRRRGITHGEGMPWAEARAIVARKHELE